MNNFRVISKKYYNEYRNYDVPTASWTLNLSEFTERLQGNVGEKLQLVEQIEISTIVNEKRSIEQQFVDNGTTASLISDLLDYTLEGLYIGATLSIELNNTTISGTVEQITGKTRENLVLDSATRTAILAAGLKSGQCYDDIIIKVTSVPEYLNYKYGLNPNRSNIPNYKSPLDTNEQSYYLNGIDGTLQTMVWTGREVGSNLGEVKIQYNSSADLYKHTFTIEHVFILPYYLEGQSSNLKTLTNPTEFQSSNSIKYGNGFFFGGDKNNITLTYEDLGEIGNVGYLGNNFAGIIAPYETKNYLVTNALGTRKIESTEVNTVSFSIESLTATGFGGGEDVIITHSKLPTSQDYGRQQQPYSDVWLFENLKQTEGAPATSGTIITNLTVTLNGGTGELDIQFDLQFTTDQQTKTSEQTESFIYFTIATENIASPDIMDRSNQVVEVENYSKNLDVPNLVSNWSPLIYEQWDTVSLSKGFTNFDGYNGDLLYQEFSFETDVLLNSIIRTANFKVVADNGSTNFELFNVQIPINKIVTEDVGGVQYQAVNIIGAPINNNFNIDTSELINQINFKSIIPGVPGTTQDWEGSIGFNVPWREWIQNLNVPTIFLDSSQPQSNRNERSSNYSGVSGYEIKTCLELNIDSDGDGLFTSTVQTQYQLLSDDSSILDYDTANAGFSSATGTYFDSLNVISTDVSTTSDGRLEIAFTHSNGVIPVADIDGYIEVEIAQGNLQPYYLGVSKDYTYQFNPLQPSDTLSTGNTQFVEVVSINNLVTFICNIKASNLTETLDYIFYGRISNNT